MPRPDKRDQDLVARLDRIGALLEEVGSEVLGQRVKRMRDSQELSIRDVAERAGLSKNSIVRLEQGGGTQPVTLLKVCSVLGLHVERLAAPEDDDMVIAVVHRHADDRWFDGADMGSGPLLGADRALSNDEIQVAIEKGARVPINLLQARLSQGKTLPSIMEIHGETEARSHVGEEFAYVLEGTATISVGGRAHVLEQGESIVFWSAEPHTYAPTEPDAGPVRVLSVRIDG